MRQGVARVLLVVSGRRASAREIERQIPAAIPVGNAKRGRALHGRQVEADDTLSYGSPLQHLVEAARGRDRLAAGDEAKRVVPEVGAVETFIGEANPQPDAHAV